MKKGFMALLCAVLLSVSAFADFIWDPLSFGYNNIFMKGNADLYDRNFISGLPAGGVQKGKMSMNNFGLTLLVAGLGYLPKKAGFYFMWENFLGVGKFSLKSEKFDKLFFAEPEEGALAFDFSTNLIFGFAFSPVDNLHLSFGAGLAAGAFRGASGYDSYANLGPIKVNRNKESTGVSVGIPFDVTGRYYLSKHAGILFGLQDTIMFTFNKTESILHGHGLDLVYMHINSLFANKFTFKFGLTTRW